MELAEAHRLATERAQQEGEAKLEALRKQQEILAQQRNAEAEKMVETARQAMFAQQQLLTEKITELARQREIEAASYEAMQRASADQLQAMRDALAARPTASSCCIAATSLVHVRGKGIVLASEVRAGESVLSWDVRESKSAWSEAYFSCVSEEVQPFVRVMCTRNGDVRCVHATHDHLIVTPGRAATRAGELRVGAHVLLDDGSTATVTSVDASEKTDRLATILVLRGTMFVNGILCSCYDGDEMLGTIENMDLRVLYHLLPNRWMNSVWMRRYATWCDDQIHSRVRRWVGLLDRGRQIVKIQKMKCEEGPSEDELR